MLINLLAVILLGFIDLYRGSHAGPHRQIERFAYAFVAGFILLGSALWSSWLFFVLFIATFMIGSSISWGTMIGAALDNLNQEQYAARVQADKDRGRGIWYLRGYFKQTPMRGLVARGFVWGAIPAVPLAYFIGWIPALVMIVAYTVAMPAGVWLVLKIEGSAFDRCVQRIVQKITVTKIDTKGRDNTWSRQEVYRGWIAGLILMIGATI